LEKIVLFKDINRKEFEILLDKSVPGDHWYWLGAKTSGGIPYLWLHKQAVRAYRVCWALFKQENADNKTLKRICDDSACINPSHRECLEPGAHTRGTRHGQAKLTELDIIDIRDKYEEGVKQSIIAGMFNVSQAQISMIVNRKMWAHVE
jgi:hypothetical protein